MKTVGVSIPIPEPHRSALHRVRLGAGDVLADRVPPHVTLMPPTEVDRFDLGHFCTHLEDVARSFEPFTMMLRGTGTFRPVSPVVFVAIAIGIPLCEQLEAAVRSGPVDRELDFNYHPHVTVAHHVPPAGLDYAFAALADFTATFKVGGFTLSELGDDERWRPINHFRFHRQADRATS